MDLFHVELDKHPKSQKSDRLTEGDRELCDIEKEGSSSSATTILGVPMKDIEQAARLANAHEFITKLPYGYHTTIGQRGTALSGGQMQRIAIARAFLRKAKVLCLDEPTSALDPESERLVTAAMQKLMEGRTVIMITHRLVRAVEADCNCTVAFSMLTLYLQTTSEHAQKIVVIAEGAVAEEGTHRELMAAQG